MIINNYATQCIFGSKNWFNIGKLIFFISGGSSRGYKLWLRYSKFALDYDEQRCYELWWDFDELMPEDFSEEDFEYTPLL